MIQHVLAYVLMALAQQPWPTSEAKNEAKRFQQLEWVTVTTLGGIDRAVLEELKARFGEDKRLADRGQPFRATDIMDDRPARRLVVAGRTEDRWLICYEAGGIGHHLVVVVFAVSDGVPRLVLLARGFAGQHDDIAGWKASIADLKAGLGPKGGLSVDDPEIYLPKGASR